MLFNVSSDLSLELSSPLVIARCTAVPGGLEPDMSELFFCLCSSSSSSSSSSLSHTHALLLFLHSLSA